MIAHVLIIVNLPQQNRHVFRPGARVTESDAGSRYARNAVEHAVTYHRIWQTALINIEPNFVLLENKTSMDDEKIELHLNHCWFAADHNS